MESLPDISHWNTRNVTNMNGMFANCSNLEYVSSNFLVPWNSTELQNAHLEKLCYGDMFANCSKLKMDDSADAPKLSLPIKNLSKGSTAEGAARCYEEMFYGCTSIEKAPQLPATTLSTGCYNRMFYSCAFNSDGAPALPATETKESCYEYMFCNCDNLTSIPASSKDFISE